MATFASRYEGQVQGANKCLACIRRSTVPIADATDQTDDTNAFADDLSDYLHDNA